jgi:hypothetical protein
MKQTSAPTLENRARTLTFGLFVPIIIASGAMVLVALFITLVTPLSFYQITIHPAFWIFWTILLIVFLLVINIESDTDGD